MLAKLWEKKDHWVFFTAGSANRGKVVKCGEQRKPDEEHSRELKESGGLGCCVLARQIQKLVPLSDGVGLWEGPVRS